MVPRAWQQDSAPLPHPPMNGGGRREHSRWVCSRMFKGTPELIWGHVLHSGQG